MFSHYSFEMSSHTSLGEHKHVKFAETYVHRNFDLKTSYGDYSSKLHSSFVSAFLSKMFNVGDLPVLTFGNCVMV